MIAKCALPTFAELKGLKNIITVPISKYNVRAGKLIFLFLISLPNYTLAIFPNSSYNFFTQL